MALRHRRAACALWLLGSALLLLATSTQDDSAAQPAGQEPTSSRQTHWQGRDEEPSVRCRMSGICDGAPPPGSCADSPPPEYRSLGAAERDVVLACITDPGQRAAEIAEAAAWSWQGYRDCAWGEDELQPLSCQGSHWLNLSLTLVDSLDTLYLLGLRKEFEEAAEWVIERVDVTAPAAVNLFETTIRIVGGLLSAHYLSAESHPTLSQGLGEKAAALGERLLPGFTTSPSGIPYSDINLQTGQASSPAWAKISSLSEVATLSLEFTHLARLTGRREYEDAAMAVHSKLTKFVKSHDGLLPLYFNPETGAPPGTASTRTPPVTLGARSDSYYEYLLKQWLLTGKSEGWLRARYAQAMRAVRGRLLRRTAPAAEGGLLYVAEQQVQPQQKGAGFKHSPKMDHLVCFLPGLLALGHLHGVETASWLSVGNATGDEAQEAEGECVGEALSDLQLAEDLVRTCYEMYRRTPTGLAPEIVHFVDRSGAAEEYPKHHEHDVGHGHFDIKPLDAHNLLRPEALESIYILWKVTGRQQYREWAWAIFRAFQRWSRVEGMQQCLAASWAGGEGGSSSSSGGGGESGSNSSSSGGGGGGEQGQVTGGEASGTRAPGGSGGANEAAGADAAGSSGGDIDSSGGSNGGNSSQATVEADGGSASNGTEACSEWAVRGGGYASVQSVLSVPPRRRDKMESFWVSETLKYLYLIFAEPPERCLGEGGTSCDDSTADAAAGGAADGRSHEQQQQEQQQRTHISLRRYVFNTEAHLLPVVPPRDTPWQDPLFPDAGAVREAAGADEQAAAALHSEL